MQLPYWSLIASCKAGNTEAISQEVPCLSCIEQWSWTWLNPAEPRTPPYRTRLNILAQHPGTRLLGRGQLRKLLQKLVRWLARLQGMHVPLLQALANETLFLQLLEDRQSIVRECERMIVFAARDSHRITVSGRNWRGSKSVRPCPCLGTSIHQVMCMCRAGCFCSCWTLRTPSMLAFPYLAEGSAETSGATSPLSSLPGSWTDPIWQNGCCKDKLFKYSEKQLWVFAWSIVW
jgi:hypothetical protein